MLYSLGLVLLFFVPTSAVVWRFQPWLAIPGASNGRNPPDRSTGQCVAPEAGAALLLITGLLGLTIYGSKPAPRGSVGAARLYSHEELHIRQK